MKISHIEHIGSAVPNLEEAIKYYENVLGLKCYKQEVVEDQKVTTAFFKAGDTKIELLEATSPDSTIAKFIEKNGGRGGMHHMAFAIEDGVANALQDPAIWLWYSHSFGTQIYTSSSPFSTAPPSWRSQAPPHGLAQVQRRQRAQAPR